MKCENPECKTGKEAIEVIRLKSHAGYWQNPMRIGGRTPARIAVCSECAEYLCNDSQLRWQSEGDFNGNLNAEGEIAFTKNNL